METLQYSTTLTKLSCGECHIPFAMPTSMWDTCYARGTRFYCPNGHHIHYYQDENSKLKKELATTKRQLDNALNREETQRARAAGLERTARALRGHLTRYRKRIANGVCPVAGCKRHFPNVQNHIETCHPEWLAEHPEVFTEA